MAHQGYVTPYRVTFQTVIQDDDADGEKESKQKGEKEKVPPKEEKGMWLRGEELARCFASLVCHGDALYLFGGKNKFFLNDLWKFDLGMGPILCHYLAFIASIRFPAMAEAWAIRQS